MAGSILRGYSGALVGIAVVHKRLHLVVGMACNDAKSDVELCATKPATSSMTPLEGAKVGSVRCRG